MIRDTAPYSISAISVSRTTPWWQARPWQTNLVLVFLGVLLFLLSRHLVFEYDEYTIGFSGTSGWSVWCYLLASFLVLTQPTNRLTLPIILGIAGLCRLATLFADPALSSDVFRYVWDGIVQHAGINPYRYVPADPAITFLRGASEGNIYPAINRATYAHTIYPPFAQIFFWVVTFVSPTLTMMKTALVLCEGVTIWSLLWLLRALGQRREQIILYAWAPILIWEIAGSGHLDSLAMALIALALVARYQRRPVLTGVFLALAVLTKLYPIVLFPALYMRWSTDDSGVRPSREWKMPAMMAGLIVVSYAAYSSVGRLVFGFLGGYVQEEGMSSGSRYFLLELAQHPPGLHGLTPAAFLVFAALVFAALTLWAWLTASPAPGKSSALREPDRSFAHQLQPHAAAAFLPPAFALAGALMLLFSPHYAWYIVWLIPFFTLLPNLPALAYLMGFFYLYTTALAAPGPLMFLANEILYGLVALAAALQTCSRFMPPLTLDFWRRHSAEETLTPTVSPLAAPRPNPVS